MTKNTFANTTIETLQWFIFMLAGVVALPIVIGTMFGMNFAEIAGFMQRSLFVVGIASLVQGLFGHRLPIMEGPAGIWISIFAIMAATAAQSGLSMNESLQQLEFTLIITGVFLFIIGAFKIAEKMLSIFTPLVTGTFFLLLTVQLSGTFLKGMLGLNGSEQTIQLTDAAIAFFTLLLILGLSMFGRGWVSNFAMLIGIMIGWIAYIIFVGFHTPTISTSIFSLPEIFAFGMPSFDWSVVPTAFITSILIISNLVAAIVSMKQILGISSENTDKEVNRGTVFTGINHGLAGLFSAIGNVPLASASGFVALTGQKRRMPFIYASIAVIIIAFFPPIISVIAGIPAPIANAALLASFVQLVGLGIRNLAEEELDARKITIVGPAYLIGMGIMFLPPEAFQDLPQVIQHVASNGLLVGTMLVIIIEQLWKEKK